MRIGLFSSYGMKCGIAQYNLSLYHAFQQLGHAVTIFGNKTETVRPDRMWLIAEEDIREPVDIVRCFNAGAWSQSGDFDYPLLFRELEERQIEIIIMQYQNGIFHDQNLRPLFQHCKQQAIKAIVTFHDSCIGPQFPFDLVENYACTHSGIKQFIPGCRHLPHGNPPPLLAEKAALKQRFHYEGNIVSTFGLGRTDYRLISKVSAELGYRFAVMDSTHSCLIGGDHIMHIREWLPMDQLVMRLGASDAVVLWYPETDALVSSSAICIALASLRPVIVNDVGWFRDIPADVAIKAKDEGELRERLAAIGQLSPNRKQLEYVQQHQWQHIARKYLELAGE